MQTQHLRGLSPCRGCELQTLTVARPLASASMPLRERSAPCSRRHRQSRFRPPIVNCSAPPLRSLGLLRGFSPCRGCELQRRSVARPLASAILLLRERGMSNERDVEGSLLQGPQTFTASPATQPSPSRTECRARRRQQHDGDDAGHHRSADRRTETSGARSALVASSQCRP